MLIADIDDKGEVISSYRSATRCRKILLHHKAEALPHPIAAHANVIRVLGELIDRFLDLLEPIDRVPLDAERLKSSIKQQGNLFKEIIYQSAEVFDFYAQLMPDSLGDKLSSNLRKNGQEYRSIIKRHRDHWGMICNLMKHSGNAIIPVIQEFETNGLLVPGFFIYGYTCNAMAANLKVHPAHRPLGYAAELHLLLSSILRCERAAAKLVSATPDDGAADKMHELNPTFSLGKQIMKIVKLAPLGIGETLMAEELYIEGQGVFVRRLRVPMLAGNSMLRFEIFHDGVSKVFFNPWSGDVAPKRKPRHS